MARRAATVEGTSPPRYTGICIANKVPVIGQLPFVGAFFSTKSFSESETELVVLVTPHLVDAQSCDQLVKVLPGQESRSPDDFELFLEGILEAPRGPRVVCPDNRYVPAFSEAIFTKTLTKSPQAIADRLN